MPLDALATNIPKRPGVPGDGSLGRQDFAKYVARIYPTITEESKVAFAQWVHSTSGTAERWPGGGVLSIRKVCDR